MHALREDTIRLLAWLLSARLVLLRATAMDAGALHQKPPATWEGVMRCGRKGKGGGQGR